MTCKHEFIGTKDGVTCKKCGLSMTTKEYREYASKKAETKKTTRKKTTRKTAVKKEVKENE